MLQLDRFNISCWCTVNTNVPVFVTYWDQKSSTHSEFGEMSGILPTGRQPKEFAGPCSTPILSVYVHYFIGFLVLTFVLN